MTSVQKNYAVTHQEASTIEDIHSNYDTVKLHTNLEFTAVLYPPPVSAEMQNSPRCSTPLINSRALYLPQEEKSRNKNRVKPSEYTEWKNRLEREKSSRIFKLRGNGDSQKYWCSENCSMISGHFEPKLADRISENTIARPAPVYHQMLLPISYQALWNNGHHQNPAWYKTPVQQAQNYYQSPPPVFGGASGEAAAAFFNILNSANHLHYHHHYHHNHNFQYRMQNQDCYTAKSQPMQLNANNYASPMTTGHYYYQYHYPAQFFTYSSEIQRVTNYLNVPFHGGNIFPVMMNS